MQWVVIPSLPEVFASHLCGIPYLGHGAYVYVVVVKDPALYQPGVSIPWRALDRGEVDTRSPIVDICIEDCQPGHTTAQRAGRHRLHRH